MRRVFSKPIQKDQLFLKELLESGKIKRSSTDVSR